MIGVAAEESNVSIERIYAEDIWSDDHQSQEVTTNKRKHKIIRRIDCA